MFKILGSFTLWYTAFAHTVMFHILRDALSGALAAVVVLNLAIPGSLSDAKAEGLLVVSTFAFALVKLLARSGVPWLVAKLTA